MMTIILFLFWDCTLCMLLLSLIADTALPLMVCGLFCGLLLALDLAVYFGLHHFLRRKRSVNLLIGLILGLEMIQIASLVAFVLFAGKFWPGTSGISDSLVFMIFLAAYPFVQACRYGFGISDPRGFLTRLEIGILCFGIGMGFMRSRIGTGLLVVYGAATLLLATVLILTRTIGKEVVSNHRNFVLLTILAVYAMTGAAVAAGLSLIRLPYEKAITGSLTLFYKALAFLFHYIAAAVSFLLSLIPVIPQKVPEITEETVEELPEYVERTAEENPVFAALMIILLAALVILLIYRSFRGKMYSGKTKREEVLSENNRRGPIRFRKLLKELIHKIIQRIRLKYTLYRRRDTSLGCYLWLVRTNRKTPYEIRSGETPHAYLTRLSQACLSRNGMPENVTPMAGQELTSLLLELRQALDAEVYGGGPAVQLPCREIRSAWNNYRGTLP